MSWEGTLIINTPTTKYQTTIPAVVLKRDKRNQQLKVVIDVLNLLSIDSAVRTNLVPAAKRPWFWLQVTQNLGGKNNFMGRDPRSTSMKCLLFLRSQPSENG